MEQEIKQEYDGFIGIYENAYDKQYIKEIISFFENVIASVQKSK